MKQRVRLIFAILVSLSGLAAGSCSRPKHLNAAAQPSPSPSPSVSAPASTVAAIAGPAACTFLTRDEIQAVQGEAFKDTKPSEQTAAGLAVSQCYFELPTPVNSVVLTIMRKADGGRDPAERWKEIFHREKAVKKEQGDEKEPLKVDGIGDEAFWTGTRVGGALYVLKDNTYIRISVGGAGDQAAKIEKSKVLAASVLKRL
jgi:hypothetical protein